MCVISLQAILTLQLVCMNPVIVVFLYEAVMIVPLSMADKHWIMDTMFLYRAGILENKYYVLFGLVYILVLIILFLVGIGIIDKRNIDWFILLVYIYPLTFHVIFVILS